MPPRCPGCSSSRVALIAAGGRGAGFAVGLSCPRRRTGSRPSTASRQPLAILMAPASANGPRRRGVAPRPCRGDARPSTWPARNGWPRSRGSPRAARHDAEAATATLEALAEAHAAPLVDDAGARRHVRAPAPGAGVLRRRRADSWSSPDGFPTATPRGCRRPSPRPRRARSSTWKRPRRASRRRRAWRSAPILHRNPVFLRPFQPLIEMYDMPSYGEVQPTAFFARQLPADVRDDVRRRRPGRWCSFSAGYCLWRYMPRFLDYGVLLMEMRRRVGRLRPALRQLLRHRGAAAGALDGSDPRSAAVHDGGHRLRRAAGERRAGAQHRQQLARRRAGRRAASAPRGLFGRVHVLGRRGAARARC